MCRKACFVVYTLYAQQVPAVAAPIQAALAAGWPRRESQLWMESWASQRLLTRPLVVARQLAFDAVAPDRLQRLRSSQALAHAGDWLTAAPEAEPGVTFSNQEWSSLLRYRLGCP